ncbi:hypothetical protein [Anabaena sp. CCY 0017]|uniref:hypothetical protein n=1 Tax=Anabaena sp. CCY 0017 TaxID=3103866 RepID=UPI0039C6FF77
MFDNCNKPKTEANSAYIHYTPNSAKVPLAGALRILCRWSNRLKSIHSVITLPYLVFNLLTPGGGLRTMASPTQCITYNKTQIVFVYDNHDKNVLDDFVKDIVENTGSLPKQ